MSRRFAHSSNAFESIISSFPPRRRDWVPQMRTSWATLFPRRVYARTQKNVRIDQYADAHGCEAGPCTDGWYKLLPQFFPDLSKRLRPINSLLRKGVKFAFTPAMEKLVREIVAELATPPILFSPIETLLPTGHVRSTCTATLPSTGLAPPSNRSRKTVTSNPSRTSAELRSTRRDIGLLLIWRPAASFGLSQTPSWLSLGHQVPHIL